MAIAVVHAAVGRTVGPVVDLAGEGSCPRVRVPTAGATGVSVQPRDSRLLSRLNLIPPTSTMDVPAGPTVQVALRRPLHRRVCLGKGRHVDRARRWGFAGRRGFDRRRGFARARMLLAPAPLMPFPAPLS